MGLNVPAGGGAGAHRMLDQDPPHEASAAMAAAQTYSLAYLASMYPMLSMTFILREVLQLRQMGFRIDVASINPPDRTMKGLTAEEAAEAARTYHLKSHGLPGAVTAHLRVLLENFSGYWRGLGFAGRLGGLDLKRLVLNYIYFTEALMVGVWMNRNKQRHLHVHLGQQAATVGLFVRRVFGFGLSITLHGPDEFYDARGQYLEQKIAAADFICCISFFARSQLMKLSPHAHWHKLVVSRLGVDPAVFLPRLSKPASDVFEILCVGRLTPAKGQHLLIDAVERLAQQGRRVRLRLVGDGPDGPSLRERAAQLANPELVAFEGAVNQDYIRTLYSAADLFCIPSFAEGIPVVLMEAMAMEIPCVTTRITGVPELICDGVDGLLVAPSDLEGLIEALAKLIDDEVLRERIAKAGRRRILEHYDLRRNVEKLATIFAERGNTSLKQLEVGSQE
jgi:colanic acid/amylovoran biosynthesis glycosyltransferase